jgi:uncharacterized damage-inducible protein DinB
LIKEPAKPGCDCGEQSSALDGVVVAAERWKDVNDDAPEAVLRSFVMNHMIHHRSQLGVYLRLNNIPVRAIYGPSADEGQLGG